MSSSNESLNVSSVRDVNLLLTTSIHLTISQTTHMDQDKFKEQQLQLQQSSQQNQQQQSFEIIAHIKDDTILNAISIIDCLIIVIGTLGNLTSFYLLTRKRLRPVSSMRYLASLTLVDTVCLYGWYLSSVYRQLSGEHIRRLENISPFMCKFISYISFSSLQLSSILLCMVTIDRLLIIISSLWRSKYANPIFANRIIICLGIIVFTLNLVIPLRLGNRGYVQYTIKNYDGSTPNLSPSSSLSHITGDDLESSIFSQNEKLFRSNEFINEYSSSSSAMNDLYKNFSMCHCYDDNDKLLRAWNKLHLCLYSLIPFPLLCVLNLIVIRMTREAAMSAANLSTNMKKFKNGQQFVTRLLLFLTLSFFLTTLPSTIVYAFWHNPILKIRYGRVILNLLNTLQFSRHSSNWIIYIYSSSFMREEFKKCIACADSEYELAEAALAERPSLAIEILRQLEINNNNSTDPDYDYYYYYNYHKQFNKKFSVNDNNSNSYRNGDIDSNKKNNTLNNGDFLDPNNPKAKTESININEIDQEKLKCVKFDDEKINVFTRSIKLNIKPAINENL